MRLRSRFLVLTLPAIIVPLACADEADPTGGADQGGDGLSLPNALSALPDRRENEMIVWGDLARAADLAGAERPEDASDPDAVVDYVRAISGQVAGGGAEGGGVHVAVVPPEVAQSQRLAEVGAFEDELGWSIVDIDRFVERQTPPDVITVMEGDFDEARLNAALGEAADGTWVAGDPEGGMSLDEVTPARPIGETLWLGPAGDTLADGLVATRGTDNTAAVSASLSGDGDGGDSLADDPSLAALAAALDTEEAYGAMLARPGIQGSPLGRMGAEGSASGRAAAEPACAGMLPEPTLATATGITDDDGPVVLVAQAHASGAAAEANAAALEEIVAEGASIASGRPWSDLFTLDGIEVTGPDDTVVVGRLRPDEDTRARMWWDIVVQRDSLVAHC